MDKYLLTIEFRYRIKPKHEDDYTRYKDKTVTIGVYASQDEAITEGNKLLESLEDRFKIHTYPDGREAKIEKFSKNGGLFGSPVNLVTNLAYLKTPFEFFAKITTLKHEDVSNTIDVILAEIK